MNIVQKQELVDRLDIVYDKLDDWDLFRYYFGDFKCRNKAYKSPLRKDENPSLIFYINSSGQPRAKDLGTGKNYSAIEYVQELYGLNFGGAMDKICSDFGLMEIDFKAEIYKVTPEEKLRIVHDGKPKEIKFMPKEYTEEELQYWYEFGIQRYETLRFFDIFSTKKFWINRNQMRCSRPTFIYYFKRSNHVKVYQPLAKKENKWFSNTNNLEDIQGYDQAEIKRKKPELLLLVSSMKEVVFLYERGITAMAAHNESANLEPDFIRHLKKYCGKIMSLYDFDEAGQQGSEKLLQQFGIEYFEKPNYFSCPQKDLTDYYKYGNQQELQQFINDIKKSV